MKALFRKWTPTTLKNKLIVTFSLLIILPFSTVSYYYFYQFERIMQAKISEQVNDQLGSINRTLEDLMGVAFKTLILIEQDSHIASYLKNPQEYTLLERYSGMDAKFLSINNSFFLSSPSVYFTLLDFEGNVYTSFRSRETIYYEEMTAENWYQNLFDQPSDFNWVLNDENYVHPDLSRGSSLLSLNAILKQDQKVPIGVARISLDFSQWFESVTSHLPVHQDYFIMSKTGEMIVKSNQGANLTDDIKNKISLASETHGYFVNQQKTELVNFEYMDSLGWYMVNSVSLDVMYAQVDEIKSRYVYTFVFLTLAFIMATLIISTTYTRPLKELQSKMSDVVRNKLNTRLPEAQYRGEMLALSQNFNGMVEDLNQLIVQLKIEERQKEAVKYQMLLAQMNPHFLHNTLNTIKWIAIREKNEKITEISISLGKLLEASLNHEKELIRLEEELELINSYEYIQKFRYQSAFEIDYVFEHSLKHAMVPKLSLQPLVENAIYHGLSNSQKELKINIKIYTWNGYLFIEVEDNGAGIHRTELGDNQQRKRPGIGLENVRERLSLLFKEDASLELLSLHQGTRVRLHLPLLMATSFKKRRKYRCGQYYSLKMKFL